MYTLPSINLLSKSFYADKVEEYEEAAGLGDIIEEKTDELGSRLNIESITIAPQVIAYDCIPAQGVLARNLPRLAKDLQLELGAESITINAPNPGTKYVQIILNNPSRRIVRLGDIL